MHQGHDAREVSTQAVSKRLKAPDPSTELDDIRVRQKATSHGVLTKREANFLLAAIGEKKPLGARDHILIPTMLYVARVEEVTNIGLNDLNFSRGEEQVRVTKGKANKERWCSWR